MTTTTRVREMRKRRGMKQETLAKAVGVNQATISNIENGSLPRIDIALKLAMALSCDVNDLFKLEGTDE